MNVRKEGRSINESDLKKFDAVYFTDSFCESLKEAEILYPEEWHLFNGIREGKAEFIDSNGGKFSVSMDIPVIFSVNRSED